MVRERGVDAERVLRSELAVRGIADLAALPSVEIVELVCRYALWLPAETYRRAPWLAPYAVRRLRKRTDERAPGPKRDLWGMPDEDGYFADDNSLIKGVVKNLGVRSADSPYGTNRLGKGLVCCHVWSSTTSDPLTFSFVPNLVWLPRSLAGYSDAHLAGPPHEAHEILKAVSIRRYREETPEVGLGRSESAWALLPQCRRDAPSIGFKFDTRERVVNLVDRRVAKMIHFLDATLTEGGDLPARFSKRYHAGTGPGIDKTVWPVQDSVSAEARSALLDVLSACIEPTMEQL